MQQRFVLTGVLFLALGVNFTLRMIFPLILTQMVYIPNAGSDNNTSSSNGELICPIRYDPPAKDETAKSVRIDKYRTIYVDVMSHLCTENHIKSSLGGR